MFTNWASALEPGLLIGMSKNGDLIGLSSYAEGEGELYVNIGTPKGSRNKFDYDEEYSLFKLGGVLPAGAIFPFD